MNNDYTVKQLEDHSASLVDIIKRRDQAVRLSMNSDFNLLIMQEFCIYECSRYAQASGDSQLTEGARADSLALAQAAGHLKRWMSIQVLMGNQAEKELVDVNQALEEERGNLAINAFEV